MYAPCVCLVPSEARRSNKILWNWSYRWLKATTNTLRIEPESSGRPAIVLNSFLFIVDRHKKAKPIMDCLLCIRKLWGAIQ